MADYRSGQTLQAADLNGIASPGSELITTQNLSQSSMFSDIPQGFRHLMIEVYGLHTDTGITDVFIRFNEDSGTNYTAFIHSVAGDGSSANSSNPDATGLRCARIGANWRSSFTLTIPGYSSTSSGGTSAHAHGMAINNSSGGAAMETWVGGGIWQATTQAVTHVQLLVIGTGSWHSLSIGTLYGLH